MGRLVAIDPGNNSGLSLWQDGRLISAYLLQDHAPSIHCVDTETVVEIPRIYPNGKGKGNPNDLISVTWIAGRLSAFCLSPIRVFPHDWKGQTPPEILERRILDLLSPEELRNIKSCPAGLMHNVTDAIGIGLWHLGRMGRGGR